MSYFNQCLNNIKYEFIRFLSLVKVQDQDDPNVIEKKRREEESKQSLVTSRGQSTENDNNEQLGRPIVRAPKVGRNAPCPCGSGKKNTNIVMVQSLRFKFEKKHG